VFNHFNADTGLLPPDILFWQTRRHKERLGIYVPPARRMIRVMQGRRERKLTIPVPGLVFVGEGTGYSVHAALARPTHARDQLYHAPFWNVYDTGEICMGDTRPPVCSVTTIGQFLQLWWESDFTMHLGGDVVNDKRPLIKFYESITNARKFPSKQLIPSVSMAHVLGEGHAHQALMAGEDEPQDEEDDGEPEPIIDEFYGPLDGTDPNGD
jgi:PRTRC genetic system protein B